MLSSPQLRTNRKAPPLSQDRVELTYTWCNTNGLLSAQSNRLLKQPTRVGGFLFSKISETPIVHVPKLFPLLHRFQNTFCFLSSSTPPHVGKKNLGFNGNFNGKMTKINKMAKNHFSGVQNGSQSVQMGVLGGYLY